MKDSNRMGRNRTGMAAAPRQSSRQKTNEGASPDTAGEALARLRAEASLESDTVGTVPPPASLKGMAKTALEMGMGRDPKAFLDKLGERLAFERTGTRLYDALLAKHASGDSPVGSADAMTLQTFRDQERRHFDLLWESLVALGADPTCETPAADLAGVKSKGVVAVATDPRVTFCQALDALMIAEMTDNEGWRQLIDLADGMGQSGMVERFQAAMAEEEIHLETVRRWLSELVREEAGLEAIPVAARGTRA
jgi:rubrerythrin